MVGKCEQCGTLWVAELINFKYIYIYGKLLNTPGVQ